MPEASFFLVFAYLLGFVALVVFFRHAWLYKNNPRKLFGYDIPYPHLDVWHPPTDCPLTEGELRSRKIESTIRISCALLTTGFISFMLFASLSILLAWLPLGSFGDEEGLPPMIVFVFPLSMIICFYVVQFLAEACEEHICTTEKLSQNERLLSLFQSLTCAIVHPDPYDNDARVQKIKADIEAFLTKERIDDRCMTFYREIEKLAAKQIKNEKV